MDETKCVECGGRIDENGMCVSEFLHNPAPRGEEKDREISGTEYRKGYRYEPPAPAPAPSAEEVEALREEIAAIVLEAKYAHAVPRGHYVPTLMARCCPRTAAAIEHATATIRRK